MVSIYGRPRLRGTAALQACTETDGPMLADSLEGVRPVGAVEMVSIYGRPRVRGTAALQACTETDGPLLADSLEGARSVGAVKMMSIYGRPRLRGTADVQACTETDGPLLADPLEGVRSVGAVKMMPIYGRPRVRGTAALQARTETDGRLLADFLEGVRSVGAVQWCQFTAGHGCEGPQPSRPAPKRKGQCWPIPWRASAPSAPCNGVKLRPVTAARDRSPPGLHRNGWANAGRSPGGRPRRRRRAMVSNYGR